MLQIVQYIYSLGSDTYSHISSVRITLFHLMNVVRQTIYCNVTLTRCLRRFCLALNYRQPPN